MNLTHTGKVFLMHLSCQSLINCNIKIYMVTLIVKTQINCTIRSCLLLPLKIIVLYHHAIVKTQDNCAIQSCYCISKEQIMARFPDVFEEIGKIPRQALQDTSRPKGTT